MLMSTIASLLTVDRGVSWLLLSEIFPAAIKGRAFSFTTLLNWGTNLVVSLTFLDLMNKISRGIIGIIAY
ncbi:hypothetical protein QZH41_006617 [Actinostola sp. cb2023]|nr:hypothetical protein QZH41_006617 [Actinostola sp. cb2023]